MSKNKKNKNITLESHDSAADEMPSNEAKEVVGQQPKKSFGRKV